MRRALPRPVRQTAAFEILADGLRSNAEERGGGLRGEVVYPGREFDRPAVAAERVQPLRGLRGVQVPRVHEPGPGQQCRDEGSGFLNVRRGVAFLFEGGGVVLQVFGKRAASVFFGGIGVPAANPRSLPFHFGCELFGCLQIREPLHAADGARIVAELEVPALRRAEVLGSVLRERVENRAPPVLQPDVWPTLVFEDLGVGGKPIGAGGLERLWHDIAFQVSSRSIRFVPTPGPLEPDSRAGRGGSCVLRR
jgi:hypothetical protein